MIGWWMEIVTALVVAFVAAVLMEQLFRRRETDAQNNKHGACNRCGIVTNLEDGRVVCDECLMWEDVP